GGNMQRVTVGSLGYLFSQHRLPEMLASNDDTDLQTSIYVGWDGEIRGRISLSDQIRPEAAPVIASLRSAGIRTALISGDRIGPAAQVARELGISEVCAERTPAGKAAILREMWKRTPAMVGDGINDAPALAAAHVGIAVAGGTKLAQHSSDVILMGDDLTRIPEVLALSRFTYRVIRQNLFWAFGYNSIAIGAAFLGRLHPLIAAAAMLASSTVVIANSLRIERWSPDRA
ncbi:MAG TPA: HAD-IC family P-type ATPase, partial [Armatimonadota bacterium]|nr:HAD-IC family P-type ATPase [Armatimonadota bacterium]